MGRARGRMSRGGLVGLERARDSAMVMSVEGRRSFSNELAGSINQFSLSSSPILQSILISSQLIDANVPMRSKRTKLKRERRKSGLFASFVE